MKKKVKIGLIILAIIITQQAFPQMENAKSILTGNQQIELLEGYSFVSSRIIAENPDMINILQSNLIALEFVRNSQGFMLQKIGPIWVNNIGDWVNTEGYLFRMDQTDELIITGEVIDPQTPINLSTGYQMIGYLPYQALNTEEVFQDVLENLEFVRNTAGLMFRKIGPNWINGIGDCKPGEGYLVKMFANDILIYPDSSSFACGDPFTDPRNEQTYNTVQIGEQCWMAENLNIGTMINGINYQTDNGVIEKFCYDDDPANCDEYGALYQWNEMMQYSYSTQGAHGICPSGWHIPTDDEWKILEGTVDSQYPVGDPVWYGTGWRGYDVGKNLKSITGWYQNGNGTNDFGFTVLPGGRSLGDFKYLTEIAYFWSSSGFGSNAWNRYLMYNNPKVGRTLNYSMAYGLSVRCLSGQLPTVTTTAITDITQTTATSGGIVSDDSGSDVTTRGVTWSTNQNPTLNDNYTTDGSGTGAFTSYLTELTVNTTYYVRAYATNSDGTDYGNQVCFSTQSGGSGGEPCPGIPTVIYEGQTYNTVLIGDQCWLRENLNVGTMINGNEDMSNDNIIEKYCYDNNTANCDEYGALYQWNEIMQYTTTQGVKGICPSGWHLPTDDEWKVLEGTVDSQYPVGDPIWNNSGFRGFDAGKNLKSTTGWSQNTGTNGFGFTAISGGYRQPPRSFSNLTYETFFWSSSESSTNSALNRKLYSTYDNIGRMTKSKIYGLSVRCMRLAINQSPDTPSSPIPEDGAEFQLIEVVLSWTCTDPEGNPLTFDIYFGTETTPPQIETGQTDTTFNTGTLEYYTEYFWKIVAIDNHNNITEGPVWSFITEPEYPLPCPGIPTITYEGQVYNTILIGEQCWLKENLNIGKIINGNSNQTNDGIIEKYCYDDDPANCDEYGGLYQWNEMMQYTTTQGVQGICPLGWHLPSDGEWTILTDFLGGLDYAGGKMKETDTIHWQSPNTGATNESGFTALPGGYRNGQGPFYNLSHSAFFWSSSESTGPSAWNRRLYYNKNKVTCYSHYNKLSSFSVRCLQDYNLNY
jgi:uncharacterized protein (TIGR02145 family)